MTTTEAREQTLVAMVLVQARRAASGARAHLRAVRTAPEEPRRSGSPQRPLRWTWLAAAFDVLLLTGTPGVWNLLERFPLLRAIATLGDRPVLVQLFALMSLFVLTALAAITAGYRDLSHTHRRLLAFAGMLTVVAGAGWLMLLAFSPFVIIGIIVVKLIW